MVGPCVPQKGNQGRVRCLAGSSTSPLPGYPSRHGRAAARRRQLGAGCRVAGPTGRDRKQPVAGRRSPVATGQREQTAPPGIHPAFPHAAEAGEFPGRSPGASAHADPMPVRPRGKRVLRDTPEGNAHPIASARATGSAQIYPVRCMSAHLACRSRQPCQGFLGRSGSRPGSRDARADVTASVRRRSA
jgi:hypothetical protein